MTERVERLPHPREMYTLRVRIIDPETGSDLQLPSLLSDWLDDSAASEFEPERWYLDECAQRIRERFPLTREYIVVVTYSREWYEYVELGGLLHLQRVGTRIAV